MVAAASGFLGMEGGLTHIEEFLGISDNVGTFYSYNKGVLRSDPDNDSLASLVVTSA